MEDGVKGKETANSFWRSYQGRLVQHGVSAEHAVWYVRWGRNFARYQKIPLDQCSSRDVLQFIESLAN